MSAFYALRRQVASLAAEFPAGAGEYRNSYDFVLREGRSFRPRALPATVPQMGPATCYFNALLLAVVRGFPYVEGFATHPVASLPVAHAWVLDPKGRAIDPTWHPVGDAYFGVRFSARRADEAAWEGDGSVLNDSKRGDPLLQRQWLGEESPGDTDGLLDKIVGQALNEREAFDLRQEYGPLTHTDLAKTFRAHAWGFHSPPIKTSGGRP